MMWNLMNQASSDQNLGLLPLTHDFLVEYVCNAQYSVSFCKVTAVQKWDKLWIYSTFSSGFADLMKLYI